MNVLPHSLERRSFLAATAGWMGASLLGPQTSLSAPRRNPSGIKITGIKTYMFNVSTGPKRELEDKQRKQSSAFKTWLFLKIETNAGTYGWGEGSGEWLSPIVRTTLHEWEPLLVDRDPLDVVSVCDDITNRLPWKGGPVFGTAIAAINMALYDIAGKILQVPVYQLLGGRKRDRIKVYHGGINFTSPERAREDARIAVESGVRGLKGNPLEARSWPMDYRVLDDCTNVVAAVRDEVGPDIELMLDTHGSPSPALSVLFAQKVAPYRPLFLEEPCKVGSADVLRDISEKSPVPIATGEKLFSYRDFKEVIDARACAFLQPDLSHSFGINNFLHIARLADEAQMLMAPHNAGGPVHFAALANTDAVVSNFLIQEVSGHWLARFHEFVDHEFQLDDGFIGLVDRPGLGIDVKEADVAKMPYDRRMEYRQYRHADGSWKGW